MSFSDLYREQTRDLPIALTSADCAGATFIVTGSNIGLGLETARHLTSLGSTRVIIAVRNLKAGEAAKNDIETTTGTKGVVEVWHLDLASYDSVKAFAKRATETLDRLDGLVENASVALDQYAVAEGHESTITINVYGTFLLAFMMMPKLRETGKRFGITPHLVIVSSTYAFAYEKNFPGLKEGGLKSLDDRKSDMDGRYGVSKMVQIFAVRELAKKFPVSDTGVIINTLSPGLVNTGLLRRLSLLTYLKITAMRKVLGRTPEMGSRTLLHALSEGKESHGRLLDHCKDANDTIPSWMTDESALQVQKRIWNEILQELEKAEPGCVTRT